MLDDSMIEEVRSLIRKSGRIITARRREGYDVTDLVKKREALRSALSTYEPAGRVEVRRARSTGTLVGLYRSSKSGIESDPQLPWATVCEDHGSVVCAETRKLGRAAMSCPDEWCPTCSGEEKL